jgi:superfamily II RNA helicase
MAMVSAPLCRKANMSCTPPPNVPLSPWPPLYLRPELMEPTSSWVRGQRFADVLELNKDVFEGSMVRALRRTEELMGQVRGECDTRRRQLYSLRGWAGSRPARLL